ncbi:MAG: DUF1501 domain-containing protein [Pirellulaceae bacterium]
MTDFNPACHSTDHFARRTLLKAAGLSGLAWLTPLAQRLARAEEAAPRGATAKSVIVLYMEGGPSQFETFDPHPGKKISHTATKAIKTRAGGIQISDWLPRVAEQMDRISLVRSVVSKEGDHERAAYNIKTGWRPDPTLVHPSLGAIICHQTESQDQSAPENGKVEIPRHVSILSGEWPARGGYLGDQYDAFKTFDPSGPIPDVTAHVPELRAKRRLEDLKNVLEAGFARGRIKYLEKKTLHSTSIAAARKMMTSDQLKAFDVRLAPESLQQEFGDTPFGRSCLAAVQLIEVGVRCVEVTLSGWDTHAENESLVRGRCEVLDPAYAALMKQLRERGLLDSTIVLWGGEFGRTPTINPVGGRDHWPHGFTIALAGGGIAGGRAIGETPDEAPQGKAPTAGLRDPWNVEDIHATVLHALGIDYTQEAMTPIGRPMAFSQGKVIDALLG